MARTVSKTTKDNIKEIQRLDNLGLSRQKIRSHLGMEELYFNVFISRNNIKLNATKKKANNVTHMYFNKGLSA